MIPELLKIGPFTVYSYGLMLGVSFIVASYFLSKQFERKKIDQNYATEITLIAIVLGVAGSKLFHLFENWSEFLQNPLEMAFSPGGLTYFGGFILATLGIVLYARVRKIPFLFIADSASPSLAIAYGIGRIGCHLSGDGDYGIPTRLPWGTNYENGIVKPSDLFRGSEISKAFPDGIVPNNTPLHPTPVYETLIMLVAFGLLYKMQRNNWKDGKLFMAYLVMAGIERFFIEFIRLNPRLMLGLSEAQLIALGLMIIGGTGFYLIDRNPNKKAWIAPAEFAPKSKNSK